VTVAWPSLVVNVPACGCGAGVVDVGRAPTTGPSTASLSMLRVTPA